MDIKLEKSQTGIASEFYVAGELCRLGYNVTLTFGNTKAIDLLIQKEGRVLAVQVKGIQADRSICWNLDKTKISDDPNLYLVLVNLHVDTPTVKPDFFILSAKEAQNLFTDSKDSKRSYLDYNKIKKLDNYQDKWDKFGRVEIPKDNDAEWMEYSAHNFLKGYGENEPDYSASDIKEPNPEYRKWKEE